MNAKSTGPRLLVLTLLLSHAGATQDRNPTEQFRAQRSVDGLRSRQVKIDLDLLGDARGFWKSSRQGRQSLLLNLFADTTFTAILDKITPHSRGYSWIGRVQGTEHSIVILTVKNNVMAGNISVPGASFKIRHSGADVYAVREVDPWAARPDGPAIEVDVESGESYQAGKLDDSGDHRRFPHSGDVTLAVSPEERAVSQAGSGDFFDLMVVYTAAARVAAGGTSAIESLIQLGVTETNLAYENSGIIPRLRLVHTEEVDYTEYDDLDIDLHLLQNGFVGNIHALRDTYGADLVQLVTDSKALFCGKAYLMTGHNPGLHDWAYSVVEQSCISPNYSLGHELAHNMGADHAPGDSLGVAAYAYSKGYVDPGGQFRTLMAVNQGCRCGRLLHYSNQRINYQGKRTGNRGQDNSLTINSLRFTVSGFRDKLGCGFVISPSTQSFRQSGGSGSVAVATRNGCDWTAASSSGWITITSGSVLAIIGKRIFLDFRRPATGHANLVSGVGSAKWIGR